MENSIWNTAPARVRGTHAHGCVSSIRKLFRVVIAHRPAHAPQVHGEPFPSQPETSANRGITPAGSVRHRTRPEAYDTALGGRRRCRYAQSVSNVGPTGGTLTLQWAPGWASTIAVTPLRVWCAVRSHSEIITRAAALLHSMEEPCVCCPGCRGSGPAVHPDSPR